jgi:sugar phosphate isomerase/epimerase
MKYIAIPYLMEEDRPGTPKFEGNVKLFEEIAKACKAKGIQLLYHNHDFEFQKMADGRYALDYIYDTIPADLLQTEVDTCWVKVAGEDPAAYVKKYTGRSPLVHLKDFHKEGRPANMYQLIGTEVEEQESHGTFEFRPVGHGDQDFGPILEASVEAGAQWVVVEQDQSNGRTPMEAITLSRQYLKEQGW